jgi:hypothetical protein
MCAAAWDFLTKRLEEPARKRQSLVLKPALAIRESTRRRGAGTAPVKHLARDK